MPRLISFSSSRGKVQSFKQTVGFFVANDGMGMGMSGQQTANEMNQQRDETMANKRHNSKGIK